MKKFFIIFFILLLYTLHFTHYTAFASIEVDPLRLELELTEGQANSDYITLTNHGTEPVEISLSQGDYIYVFSNNTIYPESPLPATLPSCKSWITLKPDKIKLDKGAKQKIQYSIDVPLLAEGEYVAAILIDEERQPAPLEENKTGQVSIKITPRISIPVYVTTSTLLERSCIISDFDVEPGAAKKETNFSLTLKNTGTTHIRPVTSLVILGIRSEMINKIQLGKSLPIFAGFSEKLSAGCVIKYPGKYSAVATVDMGAGSLVQKSVAFEVKK